MNQIQRVSTYLLGGFNGLLIGIPLLIIIQWIFITTKITDASDIINFFGFLEETIQTPEGYINLSTVPWTLVTKILGFSSEILEIFPFLLSLFFLKLIFKNYQQGEVFSTVNALHYKKLGWIFLIDALLIKSLSQTLLILAITLTNPPGHRYINIHFGTPNLKALFLGVLLIVISWVMLEASKIQEEQKFTI